MAYTPKEDGRVMDEIVGDALASKQEIVELTEMATKARSGISGQILIAIDTLRVSEIDSESMNKLIDVFFVINKAHQEGVEIDAEIGTKLHELATSLNSASELCLAARQRGPYKKNKKT